MSGAQFSPTSLIRGEDERPEAGGWTRRFSIEVDRAGDYVKLYESLGVEVRVEPASPDLLATQECADCLLADCEKYLVIYTRQADV